MPWGEGSFPAPNDETFRQKCFFLVSIGGRVRRLVLRFVQSVQLLAKDGVHVFTGRFGIVKTLVLEASENSRQVLKAFSVVSECLRCVTRGSREVLGGF